MFRKKLLALAITASLSLSGCLSTAETYEAAKKINDDTFVASVKRFCGVTASLAANRYLNDAEIIKRHEFCSVYRNRNLDN